MNVQTELQPVDFSFFHKNKTLWVNKATSTQSVQKTLGGPLMTGMLVTSMNGQGLFLGAEWSSLIHPLPRDDAVLGVHGTCSRQDPRMSTCLPDTMPQA